MKSASAASWLKEQQRQTGAPPAGEGKPILFDLLLAEAAAIEIRDCPESRHTRRLAAAIIQSCTGDSLAKVRDLAGHIRRISSVEARKSLAEQIIARLKAYGDQAEAELIEKAARHFNAGIGRD